MIAQVSSVATPLVDSHTAGSQADKRWPCSAASWIAVKTLNVSTSATKPAIVRTARATGDRRKKFVTRPSPLIRGRFRSSLEDVRSHLFVSNSFHRRATIAPYPFEAD